MSVATRFAGLLQAIRLPEDQVAEGKAHRKAVVRRLNEHYRALPGGTEHSMFIGAWGKRTRVRDRRGIDVLFWIPEDAPGADEPARLLREVRGALAPFPDAEVEGDGPAVRIPFQHFDVRLVPAFRLPSGRDGIPIADRSGRWREADFDAEAQDVLSSNMRSGGKTRDLIQMMKRWQAHCDAPIWSFWIELAAVRFLEGWKHRIEGPERYDLMVRDFLEDLCARADTSLPAPGTGEPIALGADWLPAARSALGAAKAACVRELTDPAGAGEEWRKVFGDVVPEQS